MIASILTFVVNFMVNLAKLISEIALRINIKQ